jgi:Na+/H+ antiporter NhaB
VVNRKKTYAPYLLNPVSSQIYQKEEARRKKQSAIKLTVSAIKNVLIVLAVAILWALT